MIRAQVDAELDDVPELRERLAADGFELLEAASKPRNTGKPDYHPMSKEPFFEERYSHRDGNVVRFFPHVRIANGPLKGREHAILIEYRTPIAVVGAGAPWLKKKGRKT